MRLTRTLAKKYANKLREIKKRKSKNYLQNKTYKLHNIAIYNKKHNCSKEHRYYIELGKNLSCVTAFLKADNVLRDLKVSEISFQVL